MFNGWLEKALSSHHLWLSRDDLLLVHHQTSWSLGPLPLDWWMVGLQLREVKWPLRVTQPRVARWGRSTEVLCLGQPFISGHTHSQQAVGYCSARSPLKRPVVLRTEARPSTWCLLSRFGRVWLSATPWTMACQASLPMGFSRQEQWSALPFPSPSQPAIHG